MSRGLPIDSLTSEKRDYQDSGKLAQTVGRSTRKEVETRKGRIISEDATLIFLLLLHHFFIYHINTVYASTFHFFIDNMF